MSAVDVFALPVHPAAEVFPMLAPDELAELADDIREHGLAHPIVVKAGVLIDGRNRREACRMAGIEPRTVELNGQDPTAYVLSTNIARRHLTKGQRAMVVAKLYPEPTPGKRNDLLKNSTGADFDKGYLSHARTVLRLLPEVARDVLAGKVSLGDAYELARAAEDETADDAAHRKALKEAEAETKSRRLDAVAEVDAELADAVRDGRTRLPDAERIADEKRQKVEATRVTAGVVLQHLDGVGAFHRKPSFRKQVVQQVAAQMTAMHTENLEDAARFIGEVLAVYKARSAS